MIPTAPAHAPTGCPGCGLPLAGAPTCPSCGLTLTGPVAERLWEVDVELGRLDAAVERSAALAFESTSQTALLAHRVRE